MDILTSLPFPAALPSLSLRLSRCVSCCSLSILTLCMFLICFLSSRSYLISVFLFVFVFRISLQTSSGLFFYLFVSMFLIRLLFQDFASNIFRFCFFFYLSFLFALLSSGLSSKHHQILLFFSIYLSMSLFLIRPFVSGTSLQTSSSFSSPISIISKLRSHLSSPWILEPRLLILLSLTFSRRPLLHIRITLPLMSDSFGTLPLVCHSLLEGHF